MDPVIDGSNDPLALLGSSAITGVFVVLSTGISWVAERAADRDKERDDE